MMSDDQVNDFIVDISEKYKGQGDKLVDALGSFTFGRMFGWRVLSLMISESTFRKHQNILRIKFKEVLPETTMYSKRSLGFRIVGKMNNFWKVVQGREVILRADKICID